MTVSRIWLLLTVPMIGVGAFLIVKLAMGLVRSTREAVVASLPVVAEQSVVIPADDRYAILVQGKLGERGLGDLKFSVASERTAENLPIAPVYVRSSATSLDGTVRLELYSFAATAGRHRVRVVGMDSARDYGHNRIVIARRNRGQLALRIVALVLSGLVTLGSIVGTSLLIAGRR
jgi:hypothetical protein